MHPPYLNVPSPLPYIAAFLLHRSPLVNARSHLADLKVSPSPVVGEGWGEGVKCPALQGSALQGHTS